MSDYVVSTEYPTVIRTADPLLIRLSEHSLQVSDTIYRATIKFGIKYCGFYVYQNCTGYPVYMKKDDALTDNWARSSNTSVSELKTQEEIKKALEKEAKDWIDALEEAIATKRSDNEIKKALDRLCWQLHYDITESQTDFIEEFPDFSDVSIDKQGSTLPGMVTDIQTTLSDGVDSITGDSVGTHGSLYSLSHAIETMDTNVCSNLGNVNSSIQNLDNNLSGESGSISKYIGDNLCKVDSGVVVENTVVGMIKKVATNLKSDLDAYTISKALRDSGESSVSGSVYQQTQLEQQHFTEISVNQLGAFGTGESGGTGHRTLYNTLGRYTDSTSNTLSDAIGLTTDDASINSLTGRVVSVSNTLGDSNGGLVKAVDEAKENISDVKSITETTKARIGTTNDSNTLWYDVLHNSAKDSMVDDVTFMKQLMYGDGATYNGYVDTGSNTYFVKTSG